MKKITQILTLVFVMVFISGCSNSPPLSGTIKKNIYTPASGKYSVPVPVEKYLNGRTSDDVYWVMFIDDFYRMYQIELIPMPEEEKLKAEETDGTEYLEGVLSRMYLPTTVLRDCPDSTVTYLNWHSDLNDGTLYAEVAMPEGSLGLVSKNGGPAKRVDAERGLLLFMENGDLCVVSSMSPQIRKHGESTEERIKRLRPNLEKNTVDFMKTIEFREQ